MAALDRVVRVCVVAAALSAAASAQVIRVDLDGAVHPLSAEIVSQAVEQADAEDAQAVLIVLNTPGGLLSATEEITQAILGSRVPVITYVYPPGGKAASAGFMILQAGDVAAMAPGANTGAAHPVLLGGGEMDEVMKAKIEQDTAASLRAVVDKRGRNAELAEEAVIDSRAFTDQEALDANLIDLIAADVPGLLAQLQDRPVLRFNGDQETLSLADAAVVPFPLSFRQRILLPLTDPNLAFILLALGVVGVYVEFTNPGLVFPGIFGGVLVIVGMMALSLLPINWAGAALIVFGVACLIAEAFTAANGVLTAGGAVAMILGTVMLIDTDVPELSIGWGTAVAVTLPFVAITAFLLNLAVRSFRYKVTTGSEGMVGEIGRAKSAIGESGQVFVHGELWSAWSDVPIAAGSSVRVEEVSGLRIRVAPTGPYKESMP